MFYSAPSTPTSYFDGIVRREDAQTYATYESDLLARRAVPTDVTIQLGATQTAEPDVAVEVTVCLEPGGEPKTVRLYIVQVLDHWPTEVSYSRYGFKQAAPTEDLNLQPGECRTVQRVFTFDADSWASRDNIRLVAWAQMPATSGPAEVYQAAVRAWPLMNDCNDNHVADELDVAHGTSGDCDANLVPDECEPGGTTDCDGDGTLDLCAIHAGLSQDCNGNHVPDECDLASGASPDCNGNGIPDECDLAACAGDPACADCNGNGVPDGCDIAQDTDPDCNHNGRPDSCDLTPIPFAVSSLQLSPIGDGSPQEFTLVAPPDAVGDVTFAFAGFGDFSSTSEYVDVDVNGVPVGRLFVLGQDCAEIEETLSMSPADFNAAKAGGDAVLHMVPSAAVNPLQCVPATNLQMTISYDGPSAVADRNHNHVPDECELRPGDLNCDGAVDFDDINPFVTALVGRAGYESRYPGCLWLNGDVNGDSSADFDDIGPFVRCLVHGACP